MGSNSFHEPMWVYPTIDPVWLREIIQELHIHPVMAQILVSRNFRSVGEIQRNLYSTLRDLHDPALFADMDKATARVWQAIENKEIILIYGDNDVDGMTGTALLTEFLASIGANVHFHVPNRTELIGQTMMMEALWRAQEKQATLVITVDCGITAAKEIKAMVDQGIDVIITDHHEPTEKIPLCIATLNPKVVNSTYPNRDITGVGVAFKLVHALTLYLIRLGKLDRHQVDLKSFLDLVALGTIADMGALKGENRILVRYGLRRLRRTPRAGLKKLAEVSNLNIADIRAGDVASKIAPKLNSLGRIADPIDGVKLLLVRHLDEAERMAHELDLNNIERQKIEQLVSADVEKQLNSSPELLQHKALVLTSNEWHPGVIAIVTTRLAKRFNRPTAMIAIDGGVGKGSLRTIPEFPLLGSLRACSDLLLDYGGHDYAAGLAISQENIPAFRKRFIAIADAQLQDQDVTLKLLIDARVDFENLTFELMESLNLLEPHGNENPPPILYCDALQVRPPKVVGGTHLKLYLNQKGRQLEGIGFGMAARQGELHHKHLKLRVAFTPQINVFQNKHSIQLLIRDFKVM
ncbi:MAG: single-stranded-DNA-specific exonuclease RecJ [Verrucomicrobia bacterium]|nr:single-stranded-DNA-specific exonuclease RecJ [Verrucomicrobiota bacterium]